MNLNLRKQIIIIGAFLLCVSGVHIEAQASSLSELFPAAGLALTLGKGQEASKIKQTAEENAKKRQEAKAEAEQKQDSKSSDNKEETVAEKLESELKGDGNSEESAETAEATEVEAGSIVDILRHDKEFSPVYDDDGQLIDDGSGNAEANEEENDDEEELTPEEREKRQREEKKEEEAKKEEAEFAKLVIAKVNDYVNIRSGPGEDNEIVGKLYDKSVGEFIEEEKGWYKIKSGSVTGFVKAEYCVTGSAAVELAKKVGTRVAIVNTTTLKVREEPSLEAAVLGLVPIEEELSVIEETDEWVKVDIEEGYGYVHYDYLILRTDFVEAESIEEEKARLAKEEAAKKAAAEAARKAQEALNKNKNKNNNNNKNTNNNKKSGSKYQTFTSSGGGMGSEVVNYAMQFVGNPYVYGGSSLTNGTDCSGFVMSVYKNFGVSLPHSSTSDRSQGYDVGGLENAKPGDLVCYSGHVGIYAGNGMLVHASNSRDGIIVSNAAYRKVLAVRRIF